MSDFVSLVEQYIVARKLLGEGERIGVAVSGGLDSMVLLHVLVRLSKGHGWELVVAHFNHQLRQRSSDADERFVRLAAERLGLRFVAGRADVKKFAQQHQLSLEMAARRLRHNFLARTAAQEAIARIALGHQADDQVELFFLRLLRGAGAEGLAGMKWLGPSPSDPKLMLARPLLGRSRKQIEDFAREEKIAHREDQTNAGLDFLRNRVRHQLLPMLMKRYQPALSTTVLRTMEVLEAESEFVTQSAMAWLEKRQGPFEGLPLALQRRGLQFQLFWLGLKADFAVVESLRVRPGVRLMLSPGLSVFRDEEGRVQIHKPDQTMSKFATAPLDVQLEGTGGTISFGRLKINWTIKPHRRGWNVPHSGRGGEPQAGRAPRHEHGCEYFDADEVGATIALRGWRAGDRFRPSGMAASVKLQDLFSNQKVPRARRHELALAVTGSGEVFWVQGQRISERFKLGRNTGRRLKWCWQSS